MGLVFNELVRTGRVSAPIVIGRDHLDAGCVASPNRETEAMRDGSDAVADWPILNALLNAVAGATWVSVHHGGGVGMGYSIHAGMVVVADGTPEAAAARLERVLTTDPGTGVMRHADAGYERAIDGRARARRQDPPPPAMTPFEVPRADLVASLAGAAPGPALPAHRPARRGQDLAARARCGAAPARQGALPISLDLFGAASSPDRFVAAALAALPAGPLAESLPAATRLRAARRGRPRAAAAEAVHALFDLLASLRDSGRPPRRAAPRRGHRDPLPRLLPGPARGARAVRWRPSRAGGARARCSPPRSPPWPGELWPALPAVEVPPLAPTEIRRRSPARSGDGRCAPGLTGGWPRYAPRALAARCAGRRHARGAGLAEMAPGGLLEQACRQTFETLLLRSRGYGMSKAVLGAVAREEGLNLTALVARLGRTPGATRDYLQWLVDVDALRRDGQALLLRGSRAAGVGAAARARAAPCGRSRRRDRRGDAGRCPIRIPRRREAAAPRPAGEGRRRRAGPASAPERPLDGDRLKGLDLPARLHDLRRRLQRSLRPRGDGLEVGPGHRHPHPVHPARHLGRPRGPGLRGALGAPPRRGRLLPVGGHGLRRVRRLHDGLAGLPLRLRHERGLRGPVRELPAPLRPRRRSPPLPGRGGARLADHLPELPRDRPRGNGRGGDDRPHLPALPGPHGGRAPPVALRSPRALRPPRQDPARGLPREQRHRDLALLRLGEAHGQRGRDREPATGLPGGPGLGGAHGARSATSCPPWWPSPPAAIGATGARRTSRRWRPRWAVPGSGPP